MSMIRDLRAAVRPSLRKGSRRRTARTTPPATRPPAAPSWTAPSTATGGAVSATCLTPHEALRRVRASERRLRLDRPARADGGRSSPVSPRSSGCTRWPSRTRCTRTSGPKLERYDDTPVHRLQDHPLRRARRTHRHQRGGGDRRGDVLHRPGLRHHRPARRPGLAARAAAPAGGRPGAAGQGPLGGAARHRRPGRRRLPRGRRRRAGRHRRGRDRGLLRPAGQRPARRRRRAGSTSSSARCWSSSGPSRRCCGRCSC